MSQDENDIDQSDEVCTFMLDIKLQENLFEVGESFLLEDFLQSSAANANNNAKQDKCNKFDIRYAELTGWCNKTKYNFRKLEKDNKPLTKEMTKTDIREDYFGYHYKDTRLKRPESYKFRHFSDIKKYICQYRNDHSFTSNVRKPSLPTETGVKHAFQSRQSVGTPNKDSLKETTSRVPDATQTSNGTPTNACLHYTTRKETKPALQELAYKYKLAPNVVLFNENNSNSPEHEKIVTQLRSQSAFCKSPRILSGKLPQNKLTCKMSTPLNQPNMTMKTPPLKTLTVSGYSSPKPGDVTAVRTVDQLTCITAGDRQTENIDLFSEDINGFEDSSEVSNENINDSTDSCKVNTDNIPSDMSLTLSETDSSSQAKLNSHSVHFPMVPIKSQMVSADILPNAMRTAETNVLKSHQSQNVDTTKSVIAHEPNVSHGKIQIKGKQVEPLLRNHLSPNNELFLPTWNPDLSFARVYSHGDYGECEETLSNGVKMQKEAKKAQLYFTKSKASSCKNTVSEKDVFSGNNSKEVAQNLFENENSTRGMKPKISKGVSASRNHVFSNSRSADAPLDSKTTKNHCCEKVGRNKHMFTGQRGEQGTIKAKKQHKSSDVSISLCNDDKNKPNESDHLPTPMPYFKFRGTSVPKKTGMFTSVKKSVDSGSSKNELYRESWETRNWHDKKMEQEQKGFDSFMQIETASSCSSRHKLEQMKVLLQQGPAIADGGQEVFDDKLKQRLELLRQVNKPQEKEKEKLTRLMFLRDGDMAQKLCDQRRLKHLIEQAKLKRFRPSADFFSLPTKTPHGTVNTIDIDDVTSKPNSCSPRSTISSLSEGNVFENSAKSAQGSFQDVCVGDCEWTKLTQNTPVPLVAD